MLKYEDTPRTWDVYPSTLGTNVEIEIKQPFAKNQFQIWLEIGERRT